MRSDAIAEEESAPTPSRTKAALVATLAITGASLAEIRAQYVPRPQSIRSSRPGSSGCSLPLFLLRVVGQLYVRLRRPAWLPPTEEWNLTPYRLLLPAQIVILGLMAWLDVAFSLGEGEPVEPRPVARRGVTRLQLRLRGGHGASLCRPDDEAARVSAGSEERSRSSSTSCWPRTSTFSGAIMPPTDAHRRRGRWRRRTIDGRCPEASRPRAGRPRQGRPHRRHVGAPIRAPQPAYDPPVLRPRAPASAAALPEVRAEGLCTRSTSRTTPTPWGWTSASTRRCTRSGPPAVSGRSSRTAPC